jgi:hypothetical protein
VDEHAAPPPRSAKHGELTHMFRLDRIAIPLRLDQPAPAIDDDLPVDAAVPGLAAITDDAVPALLEGFEQ